MDFKVPEDLNTNRNGQVLDISLDVMPIGMHVQKENMIFNTAENMVRGTTDHKVFDNNGGESKAEGAGTINKNGEYGPVTYGF